MLILDAQGKLPFGGHEQMLAHLFRTTTALRSGLKAAANELHSFVRVLMTNEYSHSVDVALMWVGTLRELNRVFSGKHLIIRCNFGCGSRI